MGIAAAFGRLAPATRGAILLVTGISIFGLTDNFTMIVSDQVGVGQFHFSRSLFAVVMVFVMARLFGMSVMPKKWGVVLLRTMFVAMSMLLYFAVIPMMPIAEAGAGLFTSPIFVLIFSALVFKEKIGIRRIAAVVIGSIGVLLVLQPGGSKFTWFHLMPVLGGACYAMGSITTYRYCRDESPLALLMAFLVVIGLNGFVVTSIMTLFPVSPTLLSDAPFIFSPWHAVDLVFWGWMVMIAAGAAFGLAMMTRAYQLAKTSYAVIFEYAYLISAGFFSWLLWGLVPNMSSIIGILFIVSAGVIIVLAQVKAEAHAEIKNPE